MIFLFAEFSIQAPLSSNIHVWWYWRFISVIVLYLFIVLLKVHTFLEQAKWVG